MVEDVLGVRAFSNFRKAAVKQFTSLKVLLNLKKAMVVLHIAFLRKME
jgi:hypothetical protein